MLRRSLRKKAVGISIQTIIIAVIALIVLVIIVAVFSDKISFFGQNTVSCEAKGGRCAEQNADGDYVCDSANEIQIFNTNCKAQEKSIPCCISVTAKDRESQ